jgi:muramoyltetrapeptide carboxypeptidase
MVISRIDKTKEPYFTLFAPLCARLGHDMVFYITIRFMHTLPVQKPAKLQPGDTVGIISSGFRILQDIDLQYGIERLQALGLKVIPGQAILKQHGYFAGTDADRAADINQMFADPEVKAIFQLRGGFGSARLLDLLDYKLIAKNAKIFVGMSDTTALLLGLYHKTGLVTYHGPNVGREWPALTREYVQALLFDDEPLTIKNPESKSDDLITTEDRIQVINKGVAQGRLIGGNLAVLTSIIGSEYLPDFQDAILFIEEVNEAPYRIDRMLTQLKLAGILDKIKGIIVGKCIHCTPNHPGSTYGSFHLMQVLQDHILPLNIPAWYGAMISHEKRMFTVPIGLTVAIDAQSGSISIK